jgi:hypothetical protein
MLLTLDTKDDYPHDGGGIAFEPAPAATRRQAGSLSGWVKSRDGVRSPVRIRALASPASASRNDLQLCRTVRSFSDTPKVLESF